jgi:carboxypeptidase Taq
MIRYEIEKKLISGEIEVDDLPDAWDDMYEEFLGIRAPNRTLGVLQDIHWSFGAFGYFPTYTLGNLYSAQLLNAARKELPNHDEQIRNGDFAPLLEWIEEATGSPPSPDDFVRYLQDKVEYLYELTS